MSKKGPIIVMLVLVSGIAMRNGYTGDELGYGVLLVSIPLLLAFIFIGDTHRGKQG